MDKGEIATKELTLVDILVQIEEHGVACDGVNVAVSIPRTEKERAVRGNPRVLDMTSTVLDALVLVETRPLTNVIRELIPEKRGSQRSSDNVKEKEVAPCTGKRRPCCSASTLE